VTQKQPLVMVVAYDRNRNEYSIAAHNQAPADAESCLGRWSQHLRSECSFIVLAQARRHRTEDPQECRVCREMVARSAHIEPQPTFVRRENE